MKKRVVLFLMVLASVSMLISSFAHAEAASDSDSICGTWGRQEIELQEYLNKDEALLKILRKDSDVAALKAKIAEERAELEDIKKDLNANCN